MTGRLILPVAAWPEIDRRRWHAAQQATSLRSVPNPARNWSAGSCSIMERAYGQWLSFLDRSGQLDPDLSPEARVTDERIEAFVTDLRGRVSPYTATMMVHALRLMLMALAPSEDWRWLRALVSSLHWHARPVRDKRPHMVDARQLYDLGIALMESALHDGNQGRDAAALRGRDGLIIATLICCPVRLANLAQIGIGEHLWFDADRYVLEFEGWSTKTRRPYEGELPPALTEWVDLYLRTHRRVLLQQGVGEPTRRLWINRKGLPMHRDAICAQIKKRTCDAFGRPVWPHLFRSIAATGIVDHDPEKAGLVPDLLGHASSRTGLKHYILADGTRAHEAVQSAFEARRTAALARFREHKGGRHAG